MQAFLFDGQKWNVRYVCVYTPGFLNGADVLVSPFSMDLANFATHHFRVELTMAEVRDSPNLELHEPVSGQHPPDIGRYFEYPPIARSTRTPGDLNLRSSKEVRGYHVQARDSAVGHVSDLIVDDQTWEIRYLVVSAGEVWGGRKVLIAPGWASAINWSEKKVYLNHTPKQIKDCPRWDASILLDRDYEAHLHEHFGRAGYWESISAPQIDAQLM